MTDDNPPMFTLNLGGNMVPVRWYVFVLTLAVLLAIFVLLIGSNLNPIIFSLPIGSFNLTLRWYGVLIMSGVLVAGYVAAAELRRHGENPDHIWDGMLWVLPAGVIGARIGYVVNDILGGSTRFIDDPARIFRIYEGGLHIYGAVAFGLLTAYIYARVKKVDIWLMLDAVAPALLIAQAVGRPANFVNQELYGPPTDLPWGIPIDSTSRLPIYADLDAFPVESTRFHPTFGYEIIWNLLAVSLLFWLNRRFPERFKPGAMFAGWLILEGIGRFWIEWFRPDQPRIAGTDFSWSRLAALIMVLLGTVYLLFKYEIIKLPGGAPGKDDYALSPTAPALEEGGSRVRRKKLKVRKR